MEQSAQKHRNIKFGRREITKKKEYNIQNMANFEIKLIYFVYESL